MGSLMGSFQSNSFVCNTNWLRSSFLHILQERTHAGSFFLVCFCGKSWRYSELAALETSVYPVQITLTRRGGSKIEIRKHVLSEAYASKFDKPVCDAAKRREKSEGSFA
jgi:hypothetical protein